MTRAAYAVLTACTFSVDAKIETYEGDMRPETVGWERVGTLDADRWIERGWFFQSVQLGAWAPPPFGEFDGYQRSLGDFDGAERFFIEWRVATDVPSTDLEGTPAGLSAAGTAAANYHFTITADQVRVIRDNLLPIIFVDIAPDVPHRYRLELYANESYWCYVDGEIIDSGVPEGRYPNPDSVIIWWARFFETEHTTR